MLLNSKSRTVKLIDFGLSRKVMPGVEVSFQNVVIFTLLVVFAGQRDAGHS